MKSKMFLSLVLICLLLALTACTNKESPTKVTPSVTETPKVAEALVPVKPIVQPSASAPSTGVTKPVVSTVPIDPKASIDPKVPTIGAGAAASLSTDPKSSISPKASIDPEAPTIPKAPSKTTTTIKPIKPPNKPLPPGEVNAIVGETLDYKGIKLTLDSVSPYVDKSNPMVDKPKKGYEFILLNFTASNTSTKTEKLNMDFEQSDVDGFRVKQTVVLNKAKGDVIWGDIAAGKTRKGYVVFEVRFDWKLIKFQYNPEVVGNQKSNSYFTVIKSNLK
jgi:hypothetical protein